jgi:hypothetical protein
MVMPMNAEAAGPQSGMKQSQHKVIFTVTTAGNDFYSAMTRLSVASLRLSNPGLYVMIACDNDSVCAMHRACDPLLGEVDECLSFETPAGNAISRNRFVKTSLGSLIDGPFLSLDSDILVRGDLSGIFLLDCDIAGARNHSREAFAEQVWDQDRLTLDAMAWEVRCDVYVNGGVLFFNDTIAARRLSATWHELWLKSSGCQGHCRDQPALNAALHMVKPRLTVLPDDCNAQFRVSPATARDARIWHYYSFENATPHTLFERQVRKLLHGNPLCEDQVAAMIRQSHPWRRFTLLDDLAAARIMRRNRFDGWEGAWLRRERWQYLRGMVNDLPALVKRAVTQ